MQVPAWDTPANPDPTYPLQRHRLTASLRRPGTAQALRDGRCDMLGLARPLLTEPDYVRKVRNDELALIRPCLCCHEGCFGRAFDGAVGSCAVNPECARERLVGIAPAAEKKRVVVVGGGPAGLEAARVSALRGHDVTLLEASDALGGALKPAGVPHFKQADRDLVAWYAATLAHLGVDVRLNTRVQAGDLAGQGYDEVVVATGIKPRTPDIEGIDHPKVLSYLDVLRDKRPVGRRVAVIGAGGIGFDVGEYLTHEGESGALAPAKFNAEWGIDTAYAQAGGLRAAQVEAPTRQVHLLQRKTSKVGDRLGKTTGWIHRTSLKARNVGMSSGVAYERVDDAGLHITIDGGASQVLDVDHIVVCAGQEPLRALYDTLVAAGQSAHLIGGADVAAELDAKRAILQGTTLAARI